MRRAKIDIGEKIRLYELKSGIIHILLYISVEDGYNEDGYNGKPTTR
jgi:hypothetical protein